jgi:DNA-binding response OmpR family regulator
MSLERILVLDDEPIIQKVLEELFRRKKYTVTIASTIAQAEALIARESFDLVMLDVRLPDGDGQQLLERLGALPDRPSGRNDDRTRNHRKRSGLHERRRV